MKGHKCMFPLYGIQRSNGVIEGHVHFVVPPAEKLLDNTSIVVVFTPSNSFQHCDGYMTGVVENLGSSRGFAIYPVVYEGDTPANLEQAQQWCTYRNKKSTWREAFRFVIPVNIAPLVVQSELPTNVPERTLP